MTTTHETIPNRLDDAIRDTLIELGAVLDHTDEFPVGRKWQPLPNYLMPTRAGQLRIMVYGPDDLDRVGWLACRFFDLGRVKASFPTLIASGEINRYSGKFNLHPASNEDLPQVVRTHFSRVQ